ncbi:MAG: hypothetical protein ACO3QP_04115 [Burkholderiaceae bacterium]|jgi:hypothetical protein
MKEWLLILWIGTTTNLQVLDRFVDEKSCLERAEKVQADVGERFTVECKQDLKEGRSKYPPRGMGTGIAPK